MWAAALDRTIDVAAGTALKEARDSSVCRRIRGEGAGHRRHSHALDRSFEAAAPDGRPTSPAEGSVYVYVYAVIDQFSRSVVGWPHRLRHRTCASSGQTNLFMSFRIRLRAVPRVVLCSRSQDRSEYAGSRALPLSLPVVISANIL